jgi:hypothetical protein
MAPRTTQWLWVSHPVEEHAVVEPWQWCSNLLHNSAVGPGLASANARIYFRLRGEKPFISGKAA